MMIQNEEPPCKKCENNGCGAYHDICPEYKEFRSKRDRALKAMSMAGFYSGYIMENRDRMQKLMRR